MERAAERLQFEVAARIRDAMRHIQAITGRQQALLSATRDLSLVAACPSRQEDRVALFVFRSGHLVFQQEVAREELLCRDRCEIWTVKLLTAGAAEPTPAADRIDAALLDEIQIVTAWMRQKTREGEYWRLAADADPRQAAQELAVWLAQQGQAAVSHVDRAA
jgi:excinuclease UvrABC nuclease subunit